MGELLRLFSDSLPFIMPLLIFLASIIIIILVLVLVMLFQKYWG